MEVLRQIGRHAVLVDSAESCGVWLEQTALTAAAEDGVVPLGRRDLLRFLSSGDEYLPLSLHWELLDRCNFACPFCYIVGHSSNPIVRFSEIRTAIDDLIDEGLLFCTLTGGEVTIHPDFNQLYRHLKQRGVVVQVFTNGFALDDQTIKTFQELPPQVVEVSLYTLNDERMRAVYGARTSNAASAVLRNVLSLRDAGVQVTAKTFLSTVTRDDLPAIEAWCQTHRIEHYSSSELTQAYDDADLTSFELRTLPLRRKTDSALPPVCLPCNTKNFGCALDSRFQMFPCPAIRIPDARFDVRRLGVKESLARMKAFMRRFQDTPITGAVGDRVATCMATAVPERDTTGAIVRFVQPGAIPS